MRQITYSQLYKYISLKSFIFWIVRNDYNIKKCKKKNTFELAIGVTTEGLQ